MKHSRGILTNSTLLIVAGWLIVLSITASARVGESRYKCTSRYGKPLKTKLTPMQLADKAYMYKVGATYLTCHFRQGKCVAVYVRTIRGSVTKALREANGKDWQEAGGKWQTKDGSRIAVETLSPLAGFTIYDSNFYADLQKAKAAKASPQF